MGSYAQQSAPAAAIAGAATAGGRTSSTSEASITLSGEAYYTAFSLFPVVPPSHPLAPFADGGHIDRLEVDCGDGALDDSDPARTPTAREPPALSGGGGCDSFGGAPAAGKEGVAVSRLTSGGRYVWGASLEAPVVASGTASGTGTPCMRSHQRRLLGEQHAGDSPGGGSGSDSSAGSTGSMSGCNPVQPRARSRSIQQLPRYEFSSLDHWSMSRYQIHVHDVSSEREMAPNAKQQRSPNDVNVKAYSSNTYTLPRASRAANSAPTAEQRALAAAEDVDALLASDALGTARSESEHSSDTIGSNSNPSTPTPDNMQQMAGDAARTWSTIGSVSASSWRAYHTDRSGAGASGGRRSRASAASDRTMISLPSDEVRIEEDDDEDADGGDAFGERRVPRNEFAPEDQWLAALDADALAACIEIFNGNEFGFSASQVLHYTAQVYITYEH